MPRPHKCRRICFTPRSAYFKPAGIPVSELEQISLTLDESEALRLADLQGIEQEEAAKSMKVSRQTFGNILRSARSKIADSIINGKALKIEGGNVSVVRRLLACGSCGSESELAFGVSRPAACPRCGSGDIHKRSR